MLHICSLMIQASANVMEEKSGMETSWHSVEASNRVSSTRATWIFSKPDTKLSFRERRHFSRAIPKWHLLCPEQDFQFSLKDRV